MGASKKKATKKAAPKKKPVKKMPVRKIIRQDGDLDARVRQTPQFGDQS